MQSSEDTSDILDKAKECTASAMIKKGSDSEAATPSLSPSTQLTKNDDNFKIMPLCSNGFDATFLHIVFTADDLESEHLQRSFKPKLVYNVYGHYTTMYGYSKPRVNIYFLANSAKCFVEFKFELAAAALKSILKKMSVWLPKDYFTDKYEFLQAVNMENHTKMFGEVLDTFEADNVKEKTTYTYMVTQCLSSEPGFAEFHARFQCFMVWFTNTAFQINLDDPNWIILYVYEQRRKPISNAQGLYPVGFCAVYKCFSFSDKIRACIKQFFILPPCQRAGIGTKLLKAAYKAISKMADAVEVTVQNPNFGFTCMRDMLDCQLMMELECFKYPAIKSGFTPQMWEAANKLFGINKRQCQHIYESLRHCYYVVHRDFDDFPCLVKEIKHRIEQEQLTTMMRKLAVSLQSHRRICEPYKSIRQEEQKFNMCLFRLGVISRKLAPMIRN